MNLILLHDKDINQDSNIVSLAGRRHKHIREILKSSKGDELCVGQVNGKIGKGKVLFIDDSKVKIEIKLKKNPPRPLPVHLILALPRPIVLKRLLAAIASMGVKQITLLNTRRVEKSFWSSPVLSEEKINEQFVLGLEQACDTVMPQINLCKRFKPFVEDVLPQLIKGTTPLIAHPESSSNVSSQFKKPITLMVGPEGGFIPYEVEQLQKLGFKSVKFGERILRVETAVPALISKLLL